jgi:hypothetical protein
MLPDMQYGSRPGRECISPVINKVVTYDIIRQTKISAAFIENDAVGCYDQLVNNLVFLELHHLGFQLQPLSLCNNLGSWLSTILKQPMDTLTVHIRAVMTNPFIDLGKAPQQDLTFGRSFSGSLPTTCLRVAQQSLSNLQTGQSYPIVMGAHS